MATKRAPATRDQSPGPATCPPAAEVRELLTRYESEVAKAIPAHMDVQKFLSSALSTYKRTPTLMQCEPVSVAASIMEGAILGLPIDGRGLAYIVPFYNGKTKRKEAQLIPGYRGLMSLAHNSGVVESIYAHVVYENDDIEVSYGLEYDIKHKPAPLGQERGEPIGVYAVAVMRGSGEKRFEFLRKEDVEKRMAASASVKNAEKKKREGKTFGTTTTWDEWQEEMWRKTAIRYLCKYLPSSTGNELLERALVANDQSDAGQPQILGAMSLLSDEDAGPLYDYDPETGEVCEDTPQSRTNEAKEKLKKKSGKASDPAPKEKPINGGMVFCPNRQKEVHSAMCEDCETEDCPERKE